jgi:outer membrane biogenesis lipoprotein LolB
LDFNDCLVFSIDEASEKIDFLTYINFVNYDDADKHKIIAEVDGMHIPFLHLNDLVLSKMNTGRPKDIADIDMLRKVEKKRNNLQ